VQKVLSQIYFSLSLAGASLIFQKINIRHGVSYVLYKRIKMEARLVSRFKQLLISLSLLSVIAWIVNGLVASNTVTMSAFSLSINLNSLADSFQYAAFLILLAISAGTLIALILDRRTVIDTLKALISRRGDSIEYENSRWKFIGAVVGFVIACIAILIAILFLKQLKLGNSISAGNQQSSNNFLQPPSSTIASTASALPFSFFLAFGFILLAIMFVGGLMAVQAIREAREELGGEAQVPIKEDGLEEKAANVLKEAISSIAHEGNFRAAIIRCYQRLCELLARYNCRIEDNQTVQEFRMSASKILNIPEKPFAVLTRLFEEARYSLHEIDETKRNDALRFLAEIRDYLSSGC
jgi:large-conductance mechanosensitive channel